MKPQGLGIIAAVCCLQAEAHAQERGLVVLAEAGSASLTAAVPVRNASGPALGLRCVLGLTTAVDAHLIGTFSQHALAATGDDPATTMSIANVGIGLGYHLDELAVVPFLGMGPELFLAKTDTESSATTTLRLSIGADWDIREPWVVGLAAHFHYVPAEFPRSFFVATLLGVGVHFGARRPSR